MWLRVAPEKLSNTKLSSCDDIIKNLSGDNWTVKIRPHSIHKKLAEHEIFQNFAYSNQVLCKQLRPFYEKLPNEGTLKSKLDSLKDKISYNTPKDNGLLEYLSNLLLYKALILDAKEQIPEIWLDALNKKDTKKAELQKKADEVEECKRDRDNKKRLLEENEKKINDCGKTREECLKTKEESKEKFDSCKEEYDSCEKTKKEYEDLKSSCEKTEEELPELKKKIEKHEEEIKKLEEELGKLNKKDKDFTDKEDRILNKHRRLSLLENDDKNKYSRKEKELSKKKSELTKKEKEWNEKKEEHDKYDRIKKEYDKSEEDYNNYENRKNLRQAHQESIIAHRKALDEYRKLLGHKAFAILREYQKLDYKVSIHIRFARTMNALNAYTAENFAAENFKKYQEPFHETGISDEYGWKIIKQRNLMKLARQKINRCVTVQDGGVYTTVFGDKSQERTKFGYKEKKDARELVPVWNCENRNDEYTIKQRIKDSCDNFNELIDKYVISTFANYYCTNNVLRVGEDENNIKRLYLKYVYDPEDAGNELKIPLYIDEEKKEKEVLLHSMMENNVHSPNIPGGFCYKPIPLTSRKSGALDVIGQLYAIRKNQIAVSPFDNGFHSSMWSGKKVQAAGLLAAWNGKLIAVDNMSGHYRPNWYLTYHAWKPFYEKDVFHKDAIIGIATTSPSDLLSVSKSSSQYFKVQAFMELAKNDFMIGETVKELEAHIKEMKDIGTFKVADQSNCQECGNVLTTEHMSRYHRVWQNEKFVRELACNFIQTMDYDWEKIKRDAISSYEGFPAKKILFKYRPANAIENIFMKRTKELQKSLKKKGREWQDLLKKQEDERKEALKAATDKYKEVLSKIEKDPALGDTEKYNLIKCIADIYHANEAYSELVKKAVGNDNKNINKYEAKIADWVNLVRQIVQARADKRAGLYGVSEEIAGMRPGDIYLSKEEQNKAVEAEYKKTFDHLGNGVDLSSEVEPEVKAKRLLLVDPDFKPPRPKERPPKPKTKQPTAQQKQQPPTQPTAQPRRQPPKQQPPKQQQPPKKTRGAPYKCINGHESYFGGTCTRCGKQLESVK